MPREGGGNRNLGLFHDPRRRRKWKVRIFHDKVELCPCSNIWYQGNSRVTFDI